MATFDDYWFEVWYVSGVDLKPAYLVVVAPSTQANHRFTVTDINKNEDIFTAASYEEVRDWLVEDDFSLVDGRVFPVFG